MQMRKWACGLLCLLLAALFLLPASAAAGPTLAATLPDASEWENAIVQRGSRRTFDVWRGTPPAARSPPPSSSTAKGGADVGRQ
ncbi:MAG: hypothetical protein ACLUFV_07585 [Acutalibacteraceae bacterium]